MWALKDWKLKSTSRQQANEAQPIKKKWKERIQKKVEKKWCIVVIAYTAGHVPCVSNYSAIHGDGIKMNQQHVN